MFILERFASGACVMISDQQGSFYLDDARREERIVPNQTPTGEHDGTIFTDEDLDLWVLWPIGPGSLDKVLLFDWEDDQRGSA